MEMKLRLPEHLLMRVDKLTMDGPAPIMPDKEGRYAIPQPGIKTAREY